jgi:hypothetical protein
MSLRYHESNLILNTFPYKVRRTVSTYLRTFSTALGNGHNQSNGMLLSIVIGVSFIFASEKCLSLVLICLDFVLILCNKIKYDPSTSQRVRKGDLGDVVVLDADNNKIETPFQDLESLPPDVVSISK